MGRKDFGVPVDGNWYLCMQKPFKIHPEFHAMLGEIVKADPQARLLMHDIKSGEARKIVNAQYKRTGMDMERVHFLPVQPHHKLMALYDLSDVVLDSYFAGGSTTSREAWEVGAVVVTLPGKYFGMRLSAAYYGIMGVQDAIASDKADYVRRAVHFGTNKSARLKLQRRILDNVHKLFEREEAV